MVLFSEKQQPEASRAAVAGNCGGGTFHEDVLPLDVLLCFFKYHLLHLIGAACRDYYHNVIGYAFLLAKRLLDIAADILSHVSKAYSSQNHLAVFHGNYRMN